jgi:hypothetical protein
VLELPIELEDDSEDLTDKEVKSAIPVASVDAMINVLRETYCLQCNQPIEVASQALRRRAPFLYSRVGVHCTENHVQVIVFRTDWLIE